MKSSKELLDELILKKDDMAKAISLAYADGDIEKAQMYFELLQPRIQASKPFIFDEPKINKYTMSIKELYKEISDFLGYDIREQLLSSSSNYNDDYFIADVEEIDLNTEKRLRESYKSIVNYLSKVNIKYQDYIDMYRKNGIEYIKNLHQLFYKLQEKKKFYYLKEIIGDKICVFKIDRMTNKIKNIIDYFDIKSSDDLMKMYTELSSFDIDYNGLSEEEYEAYKQNIESFKKRKNSEHFVNSKAKRRGLLKTLEKIYANEFMKNSLDNYNVQEFLKRYNYPFNGKNFKRIVNDYLYLNNCYAYTCDKYIEGEPASVVFFKSDVINESTQAKVNELLLHEFIHICEKPVHGLKRLASFASMYTYLNEGMTDYLAQQASNYLKEDILNVGNVVDINDSAYQYMAPMVEMLANSSLWESLIKSKIDNSVSYINKKVGIEALELNRLFRVVYDKTMMGEKDFKFEYEDMKNLINMLEKNNLKQR